MLLASLSIPHRAESAGLSRASNSQTRSARAASSISAAKRARAFYSERRHGTPRFDSQASRHTGFPEPFSQNLISSESRAKDAGC
jgi:hypothetical protein